MSENTVVATTGDNEAVAEIGLTKENLIKIEEVSKKYLFENIKVDGELQKAVLIAQGLKEMQKIVTPEIMAPLMNLMGTTMGFVTDKDDETDKYSVDVVKQVLIEGMLNGVFPYNNQLNILVGRLYIAKNGYTAKISKLEDITDFVWRHELVDKTAGGHHWVGFKATWKQSGVEKSLDGEIPIKKYSTDSPDAVMGKGERKLKYRCYCAMTETKISEAEELDATEMLSDKKPTALEDRAAKVKAQAETNTEKGGKKK